MKFEELGYERLMPAVDGRKERAIGMRLHRIARDVREKPTAVMGEPSAGFLTWLGTEYMGLGSCHYQLVPPRSNAALADKNPDGNWHENWAWRSEQCVLAGDADGAWACAMVLKGRPVAFTDCILKPLYSLKKQGEVLQKVLEVKARTRQWVVELPGTALATATRLREYLLTYANVSMEIGQEEVDRLVADWNHVWNRVSVKELNAYGWSPEARAFVAADCMISEVPEMNHETGVASPVVLPNSMREHGYYRLGSGKWKLGRKDVEGKPFMMSKESYAPRFHPEVEVKKGEVMELVQGLRERLYMTMGGFNGHLVLGSTLAYFAGDEVFEKYRGFPGVFLHGLPGQGKTTVAMWMVRIFGMRQDQGTTLEGSSNAGVQVLCQQLRNIPLWIEEFQNTTRKELESVLKGLFGRESLAKVLENGPRKPQTSAIVTGNSTSSDQAVRTRFMHVMVDKSSRLPRVGGGLSEEECRAAQQENFDWLDAHKDEFWKVGRWVLRNRAKYVAALMKRLEDWMEWEGSRVTERRAQFIYGLAWAGMRALEDVLGLKRGGEMSNPWDRESAFMLHMVMEARGSVVSAASHGDLSHWLDLLVSALTSGFLGSTRGELRRYFHAKVVGVESAPPGVGEESAQALKYSGQTWKVYHLMVNPDVYSELQRYARQSGEKALLRKQDLREHMTTQPWHVRPPTPDYKQRFAGEPARPWIIALDLLAVYGYTQVSDEEYQAWKEPGSGGSDPRRGALYGLVDLLEAVADEAEQ